MPLWQRLLITLVVMVAASFLVGLAWRGLFNAEIPSYLSGLVGGVVAIPCWDLLRRVRRPAMREPD
jgi:glucose-6-phosphate-specific signal transduction histidine kinase